MNDSITRPIMVPINLSATGVVIPAATDKYLYIRQIAIIADGGANTITIQKYNGSTYTDLSLLPLQANGSFVFENTEPDYPFLFDIEPGSSLVLDLSDSTQVSGHISYGYRK